jgi:hypothetical protein
VSLDYLPDQYARYVSEYGLDVSPDFQRGHVWTNDQKQAFMEYFLRGGASGRSIYLNAPGWMLSSDIGWFVLVDGKQRLDAALGFLNNEFKVFGHYFREFEDRLRMVDANFIWYVNTLKTRQECLQWYLDLNTGGTPHTREEIDRVRSLMTSGEPFGRPSKEEILANANLDRAVIKATIEQDRARDQATSEAKLAAEKAANSPKRKRK